MSDHVVVVGAGFSGLAAARSLVGQGARVTVLEARHRVGGRTSNESFPDGTLIESGGQWVGPTQDAVLALADEYGVSRYPTPEDGHHRAIVDGEVRTFNGDTFALPVPAQVEAQVTQKRLERMAATVPLEQPWAAPRAERWDAVTVDTWLGRHVRLSRTRELFHAIVGALFSAEASQLSLLHFLFYCHSGGMLDRLLGTRGGAQEWRLVGGTQGLAQQVADELGDRLRLGTPVASIVQDDEGLTVSTAEGAEHRGRRCIVTVPPHLVGRIAFDPALSPRRAQLIQSVPMGSVIKIHVQYPTPFWRSAGWSGFAVSPANPVSLVFDNTPEGADCGVLVAFLEGRHAKDASTKDPEQRRGLVVDALTTLFGPAASEPIGYHERDWAAEPWTGGCYGGHLGPGVWTQLGPDLRPAHGRVHWAGTETATRWSGYIDGAIRSGQRAASEALAKGGHDRS